MLKLFKNVFSDLLILYKNFIHWNISKVIVVLYAVISSLLLSIPFFVIIFITFFLGDFSSFGFDLFSIFTFISTHPIIFTFLLIIGLVILTIGIFMFSYSKALLINLSLNYLDGKKLSYKKNHFFNLEKLFLYFKLFCLNGLILSIPILVVFIFFVVTLILSPSFLIDGVFTKADQMYGIISFALIIIAIISFSYLYYRVVFSYYLLMDKKEMKKELEAKKYIKKSFKLTSGWKKFIRVFVLFLLIFTIFLPINIAFNSIENLKVDKVNFLIYNGLEQEEKDKLLSSSDSSYYSYLELTYSSDDVSDISRSVTQTNIVIFILNIFYFLVFYGIVEMLLSSLYRRLIIK